MAIVFVLILRTSLHVREPNSHANSKPLPSVLTYETPIFPHLAVPECSGRVTTLAKLQIRASVFGRRLPFRALLWCSSTTERKPGWIFCTAALSFFHYSLPPHRRVEEKVCDTRQKKTVFGRKWIWRKRNQKGRWEKMELMKWEKKWNGKESELCWKRPVGWCWMECVTNKWWAPSLDSSVIGSVSLRH